MRNYLIGFFALCLVCCVIELLSPEGEGGGIRKHIRLLTALCMLCWLYQPFLSLIKTITELPEKVDQWLASESLSDTTSENDKASAYKARWQQEQATMGASYAAGLIGDILRGKYDLAESDCRVHVVLNEEKDGIKEISVALSGKAIWQDTHKIEEFAEETFGCPCTIYIE